MKVLIDTSIWSLALRRRQNTGTETAEVAALVEEGLVEIIGPIRQEILSGIADRRQFEKLRDELAAFEDIPLERRHFEVAAEFFNLCCGRDIQGSHTDFLICAVASLEKLAVFTTDRDFLRYAKLLPIATYNQGLQPGAVGAGPKGSVRNHH